MRSNMKNIQAKIEQLDSKIKNLVEQKNSFLQKKKHAILKEIENSDLATWEIPTLKNAIQYLKNQKDKCSEIYKDWEKQNGKNENSV